jgi:hypothetical protein
MVLATAATVAHQCGHTAKWHPVFVLRCKLSKAVSRAAITVHLCDSCRQACALTDLMTDSGWQTIVQAFLAQGKLPPKRSLTKLDWIEIGSAEARALLSFAN